MDKTFDSKDRDRGFRYHYITSTKEARSALVAELRRGTGRPVYWVLGVVLGALALWVGCMKPFGAETLFMFAWAAAVFWKLLLSPAYQYWAIGTGGADKLTSVDLDERGVSVRREGEEKIFFSWLFSVTVNETPEGLGLTFGPRRASVFIPRKVFSNDGEQGAVASFVRERREVYLDALRVASKR